MNLNTKFDNLNHKFTYDDGQYKTIYNPFPLKHIICEDYENKIYINNFSYIISEFKHNIYKRCRDTQQNYYLYILFMKNLITILKNIDKNLNIFEIIQTPKYEHEDKYTLNDFIKFDNEFIFEKPLMIKSKIIDLNTLYYLINKDMEHIYIYKNDIELNIKGNFNYKRGCQTYTIKPCEIENVYENIKGNYKLNLNNNYDNLIYIDVNSYIKNNIILKSDENEKQKLEICDKQLAEIKNENNILKQQIKELQDNYLNLKSNFEIYTELINELRNENKELKKQVKQLQNENIDLYSNLI